ncbi:MAG: PAS domain S-box protein [Pseudomonadota bacterium]
MLERDILSSAIVEGSLEAILTIDQDGTLLDFNPSAEKIFGYRRDDVLGQPIAELIIPPRHRDRHHQGMSRYLRSGTPHILGTRVEIDGLCADGTEIPVELTVNEVEHDGQRLFTASLRDLRERRAAEAQIEEQREALAQSEKLNALGSLLATVAHELNNPLSILVGQTELISDHVDDPTLQKQLDRIRRAADRCAGIVRSYLAVSRQETPTVAEVEVSRVINAAVDLLQYAAESSGIEVETDIPSELTVAIDESKIAQVLLNLLSNAHQALLLVPEPRRLRVDVEAIPGDLVRVRVMDSGLGVAEVNRTKIFDPFFTTKAEGTGTGIGLAVSRQFIEGHGGTLDLEVLPGWGGVFAFTLPTRAQMIPASESPDAGSSVDTTPRETATILVIDDEVEVAETVCGMLRLRGFETLQARSGREALQQLQSVTPDAIISDIRMADVDGAAFLQLLQDHHPHLAERTGFLTGDTMGSRTVDLLTNAGRPHKQKPFTSQDLVELVNALLDGAS